MAIYDVEKMLVEIRNKLKNASTGLNAKLAAINAGKQLTDLADYGYVIACDLVDDGNIYLLNVSERYLNAIVFAGVTIDAYETDPLGGVALSVKVSITMRDQGDFYSDIRAIRYVNALRQVFERDRFIGGLPSEVQRIRQVKADGLINPDDGQQWREVGIVIDTVFAAY